MKLLLEVKNRGMGYALQNGKFERIVSFSKFYRDSSDDLGFSTLIILVVSLVS